MKKWNCNDILRQVAAENGVTLQEVRAGIQETIDVCWNNPDPKIHVNTPPENRRSDRRSPTARPQKSYTPAVGQTPCV